jgi:GT2 family glycosyltransferase
MKIAMCVPVMNQAEVTQQWLDSFRNTEQSKDIPLILIDNGSQPQVRDWLIGLRDGDVVVRNDNNVGVLPALNQGWRIGKDLGADYIFYTHNDVLMFEQGWDTKLHRLLEAHPDAGVAGFYGAKGIGTWDIYQKAYIMQQLVRVENVSNCNRMDAAHGYRNIRGGAEVEEVAVMDGFSLIVKVELLNKIDGFDWRRYPLHHMYDNDICLESLNAGYKNYVFAMDCQHLGGRTDVGENWATAFGKEKHEVHAEAHPPFYEKWHPAHKTAGTRNICLPVRIA